MRALAVKLCLWARPRAEESRGCVARKKKKEARDVAQAPHSGDRFYGVR